jgi:hypothetical protein
MFLYESSRRTAHYIKLAKVSVCCDGLSTFTMLLLTPPVLVPYIINYLTLCMVTLSGVELIVDS